MCVAAEGRLCTPRTHRAAPELAGRPPCPRGTGPGEAESGPRSKAWEIPLRRAQGSLQRPGGPTRESDPGSFCLPSSLGAPESPEEYRQREKSRVISKALKSPHSELRGHVRRGSALPPCGDTWYFSLSPGQPASWGRRQPHWTSDILLVPTALTFPWEQEAWRGALTHTHQDRSRLAQPHPQRPI